MPLNSLAFFEMVASFCPDRDKRYLKEIEFSTEK
jgi:hypothetical protein